MEDVKQAFFKGLKDPGAFRYLYVITLLLCSVSLINQVFQVIAGILLVWSFYVMYRTLRVEKKIYKVRYWGILLLFLVAGAITALTHLQDHFLYNAFLLYHVALCFFLFYGMHADPDKRKVKQEMVRLMKAITILTTALSVGGLLVVLLCVRIYVGNQVLGLMDNRFTGLYVNPNPAAFSSMLSLMCCHLLYRKQRADSQKRVLPGWFCVLCVVSNMLALLLSDSNGAMVFILIYAAVLLYQKLFFRVPAAGRKTMLRRGVALGMVCVVSAAGMLGLRVLCQNGVGMLVSGKQQMVVGDTINPTAKPEVDGTSKKPVAAKVEKVEIGRSETNYDVSSGRFDSLEKGLALFAKFPILGVGQGNIVSYGERYLNEGFAFNDLHNGYLTLLVAGGVVGFTIFMAFLFVLARRMYRCLRANLHKGKRELPLLFAMLGAYCVYSLFDITLLLNISFTIVIFWLLMGYATTYLMQYESRYEVVPEKVPKGAPRFRPAEAPLYLMPTGRSYSSLCLAMEETTKRDA